MAREIVPYAVHTLMRMTSNTSADGKQQTRIEQLLLHFQRTIHSREGVDITLLFGTEAARLFAVLLGLLSKSPPASFANKLPGLLSIQTRLQHVFKTWSSLGRIIALMRRYTYRSSTRLWFLVSLLEEWQIMARLFGSIDVWMSTKALVSDRLRDLRNGKEEKNIDKFYAWMEVSQSLLMAVFHAFEALVWLANKKVLSCSSRTQMRLTLYAARSWAAYVFIDLARQLAERWEATTRSTSDQEEEKDGTIQNKEWRKQFCNTLGWVPLTLHWSLPNGFLPEVLVPLFGVYATWAPMNSLWRAS